MPEPLDPEAIFDTLAMHDVEYVLIGGLAAVLYGSPTVTNDADVCPRRTPENLERLAAALRDMDARIRAETEPDGLASAWDASFLARMQMVNLVTKYGTFDLTFAPAGFPNGYDDLVDRAVPFEIAKRRVLVASLRDVIRSKEAADRPRDHATLPILRALQDEIEPQGS